MHRLIDTHLIRVYKCAKSMYVERRVGGYDPPNRGHGRFALHTNRGLFYGKRCSQSGYSCRLYTKRLRVRIPPPLQRHVRSK